MDKIIIETRVNELAPRTKIRMFLSYPKRSSKMQRRFMTPVLQSFITMAGPRRVNQTTIRNFTRRRIQAFAKRVRS